MPSARSFDSQASSRPDPGAATGVWSSFAASGGPGAIGARTLLQALLAVDALLIVLHVMDRLGWLHHPALRLQQDGGVAEWWQYAQTAAVAGLLLWLWRARGPGVYAAWAALFAYIVADDSLQLHERGGEWLSTAAALPAFGGLRPQDLGELLVLGSAGVVLVGGCLLAHWRCAEPVALRHSRTLLGLLALLVLFGVVADMAQFVMAAAGLPLSGMTIVEDGGEIVVVSLALAVVFGWQARERARRGA